MIDYQAIVENLEVEKISQLLYQLGADEVIDKGNAFITNTICHNEDATEASLKLYFYKDTHLFYCYTNCGPMSIFKFLKEYYETRNIDYDWYNDIFQVAVNCSASNVLGQAAPVYRSIRDNYAPKKDRHELPQYNSGVLDTFIKYYPPEWLEDGITPAAMDKYNIRYSISQNKIIIPHYDINNRLVGIRGRALNPIEVELVGKYMPVQIENKWYSHPLSLNLYGLNKNWENIKRDGVVFIFESEKSVLQCDNFEMKNYAVAVCGSNINKYQIDLLMRYCQPKYAVICFDNEEEEGKTEYFDKLYKMCKKYTNYCGMSFVYDRNKLTNSKDSPSDRGEAIFIKLLEERVVVK